MFDGTHDDWSSSIGLQERFRHGPALWLSLLDVGFQTGFLQPLLLRLIAVYDFGQTMLSWMMTVGAHLGCPVWTSSARSRPVSD